MLTPSSRLRDFPSLADRVYLNTAAEGIPPCVVGEALAQYTADHELGMDGRERHEAQWRALRLLTAVAYGLEESEVGICSCSSEAFNLLASALRLQPGDEVIINDLDFPAGATPWLQYQPDAVVKIWRSRRGALRVDDIVPLLGPRTRLVSTSLVSFYNGYMVPLSELKDAVHTHSSGLLAVDVTQALGRVPLDLLDVDFVVSSTHKWILGSHGGGLVGIPSRRARELTTAAGGWFHLQDGFEDDRFERTALKSGSRKTGAASYMVGMPNYAAIYAIRAALQYHQDIGVGAIDSACQPLMAVCIAGLKRLSVELITPDESDSVAGIVAFIHPQAEQLHAHLHAANIHVMYHASRIRVAIHGYNTAADVERFLKVLTDALTRV